MTATSPPTPGRQEPPDAEYVGEEMTLYEHLEELRQRLFKSAAAIALGFVVGFILRNHVMALLSRPYCSLPPRLRAASTAVSDSDECALIFIDVLGAFFISLKAAAIVAVLLSAPVVCYQIWRFVTPGLRPVERRYALPFVVFTQVLFAAGAVFSYFIIPRALEFLLAFAGPNIISLMDANRYLTFVLQTMLAFGIAFEFPLVLIMLAVTGAVSSRGLRKYRRHALFGTFAGSAVITPTQDPLTMCIMAVPLAAFYEISILVARGIERRRGAAAEVASAEVVAR